MEVRGSALDMWSDIASCKPIVLAVCSSTTRVDWQVAYVNYDVYFNMGQNSRLLFFCPFLNTVTNIAQNLTIHTKSRDDVFGIQTWDRWMVGEDESTELWRSPYLRCCL